MNNVIIAALSQAKGTLGYNEKSGGYTAPMDDAFINQILTLHNTERAKYNEVPLKWDPAIAAKAAYHGERCWYEHSDYEYRYYISEVSPIDEAGNPIPIHHGENIAVRTGDVKCDDVEKATQRLFDLWNGEYWAYDCIAGQPKEGQTSHTYGHWYQIVWADTTHIGCAMVCGCEDFMKEHGMKVWGRFLICEYGIDGNYGGARPFPLEDCPWYHAPKDTTTDTPKDATTTGEPKTPFPVEPITTKEPIGVAPEGDDKPLFPDEINVHGEIDFMYESDEYDVLFHGVLSADAIVHKSH